MGFLSANGLPRDYHGQYTDHEALYIAIVKSHYTREGCRKNEIGKPFQDVCGSAGGIALSYPYSVGCATQNVEFLILKKP